jgi:hypothetical protein
MRQYLRLAPCAPLLVIVMYAVQSASAQVLDLPATNTIHPNIVGPVSKIVPFVPRTGNGDRTEMTLKETHCS